MPHYLEGFAGSPWVLVVVFVVAGLDAMLPFMPSESTVVAVGVVAASTGRPHLAVLVQHALTPRAATRDLALLAPGKRGEQR